MVVQDMLALARLGSSQGAEGFPELGVCVTKTSQRRLLRWRGPRGKPGDSPGPFLKYKIGSKLLPFSRPQFPHGRDEG